MFVIFLWFGFSFLHLIPATDTSCRSLFLFIVLLHISFHAYPFIQKNLGLCGLDNVDWIKRVLGLISLCLPKPFCQGIVLCGRSVFCSRFVFCGRFAFCYRLLSLAFLSLDLSYSLVFLVGLWALLFHWAFFLIGFWIWICKNGHQHSAPWAYGLLLQFVCENSCSFLSWVVSQLTCECLSLAWLFLLIACMLLFDLCLLGLFGPAVCFPFAKFH